MKKIAIICFNTAFAACALALSPGFLKTASFIVRAIDEGQQPVTNAIVSVAFYQGYGAGMMRNFENKEDRTDTNGICRFKGKCEGNVGWNIGKNGYYTTIGPRLIVTNSTFTQWLPADKEYEIILRPILNPIPMYARKLHGIPIPAIGEPLSYDLEKGDWLSPYGNGQVADFLFHMDCQFGKQLSAGENVNEFHATLTMTFPNEKDGIVEISDPQPPLEGSIFRLPRFAPEVGYSNRWSVYGFETEGQMGFKNSGSCENPSYFYRVRTKTNETGQIISAYYGKIRGPISFGVYAKATSLSLTYYFNPTPNDRNMEFDPSRNLFADLPVTSQVRDP